MTPYPPLRVNFINQGATVSWECIRNASTPVRGTFRIGYDGIWSTPINWNDDGSVLAARLASINITATVSSSNNPSDGLRYWIDISLPLVRISA
jgi:hypothetical protein